MIVQNIFGIKKYYLNQLICNSKNKTILLIIVPVKNERKGNTVEIIHHCLDVG